MLTRRSVGCTSYLGFRELGFVRLVGSADVHADVLPFPHLGDVGFI